MKDKKIEKEIRALAKKHAQETAKLVNKYVLDEQEFGFHYDDEFASELGELMNGDD